MKNKILFVIDSLHCAGAEKSLITLLSLLDYSKYTVDLMLFSHGALLEEFVPREVNILSPLEYTKFTNLDLKKSLALSIKQLDFTMFSARIKYSFKIRTGNYNNPQKARIFWQCVSKVIDNNPKEYDIAISYAQGIPTFYVAQKVKAKRKYAWVNASFILAERDRDFQKEFYDKYNKIIAVSHSAKDTLLETFPYYSDRVEVIYDINNPDVILNMADIDVGYRDNFNGIRILTVGRMAYQKGYDIALEACKKLKNKGIKFRWYVLGTGPLQKEIEEYIRDNDLSEHFILLGVQANPYPFIKYCDIYVQTSRFEGFGLAIAEARMLNVPVVTTRFDAVYNQMVDGKNGLVVDIDSNAVCDGILRLINDSELRESIVTYLRSEKKGNVEEITKFYQLIG